VDSESLSSLLAATVAFAIGTSVVLRDRSRQQTVRLAVFCFNLGLYHLARFFHGFVGHDLLGSDPFAWFGQTIALLLPWSADRLLASFVPSSGTRRWQPGSGLRTTLGFSLFVAQTISLVAPDVEEWTYWKVVPWTLAVYVIGGLLFASMRLWWASRAARQTALAPRLRYLFYASLVALAVGVVPAATSTLGWRLGGGVGPIVTAVYLYFVEQTLRRERLLDLPEIATRILSLSLLVLVVTGLYAALLVWIDQDEDPSLFMFNAAVASFAVVILLEPVRREIDFRIEGWLFHDRPVLRRMLVRLRQRLLNVIDVDEMARLVIESLESSGRVTQASLYLLNREGTALVLQRWTAANDEAPPPLGRLDLATRRPLLERLQSHGTVLRDELERERERAGPEERAEVQDMLDTLGALEASLALPILGRPSGAPDEDPDIVGALFVDDQRLVEPFAREEVELFEGVVAQAATTVQNSAVYEARKERERLAALGEMAAGLAHEIRNPLGAMKGAVQVLRPSPGGPGAEGMDEQTREFLDIILEEVDRLNRVVTQFLTYSRPFKGELEPIDLREVVTSTLRLVPEAGRARLTLEEAPADLPLVRGDPDALRQVLLNLVLNALDAIGDAEGGAITVSLSVRRRGLLRTDAVALDVCDNGPGLSAQTMTNLFVPFHTTKSGGTGLGLPISQRIVQNHQGAIEVGRSGDDGARFTVLLPVADKSRGPSEDVPAAGGPVPAPRATSAGPPAAARVALP